MRLFDLFGDNAPALTRQASTEMGEVIDIARSMWRIATSHLLYGAPMEANLASMDEGIDSREQNIRKAIFQHIEKAPHEDLVLALVLVSTVHEGERIGDWIKRLAELAELSNKPLLGPKLSALRIAADRISVMFDKTYSGFVEGIVVDARSVMVDSAQVKANLRAFSRELASSEDLDSNAAVVLSSAALMMGRISAHLSNIASSVVLPYERIRGTVE